MNSSNPPKAARMIEGIVSVPLAQLRPYANHPFKPYSPEKLEALAESIAREGLQHPVIVRGNSETGYKILSGHNRVEAVRRLGRLDIPAIVRNMDDRNAALVVVDTNLEPRKELLPSEKAFAYKLRMDTLKSENGDSPSDTNGLEPQYQNDTDSHAQIFRFIRLTCLVPELLDLVDQNVIPVMAGYEVSFLDGKAQNAVYLYFFQKEPLHKLSVKNAKMIRAAYDAGQAVTAEGMDEILRKPKIKRGAAKYSFSQRELARLYPLPEGFDFVAFVHEKLKEKFLSEEGAMPMKLDQRDFELLRLIGLCKDIPVDCSPLQSEMFSATEFSTLSGAGYIRKSKSKRSYRLAEKGYALLEKLGCPAEKDKYPLGSGDTMDRRLQTAKAVLSLYRIGASVFGETESGFGFVPAFTFRRKNKGEILGASKMCGVLYSNAQTIPVYFISENTVLDVNTEMAALEKFSAVLQSPKDFFVFFLGDDTAVFETFTNPFEIDSICSLWGDALGKNLEWALYEPLAEPLEVSLYA